MPSQYIMDTDDYRVEEVNPELMGGFYRLLIKYGGYEYITQTGSDISIKFPLPTQVRLRKCGVIHSTSTVTTRSTDVMTFKFGIFPYGLTFSPAHWLVDETFNEDVKNWELGTRYEEPVEHVEVLTNSTNTDRVRVYVDVQVIGKGI